MADVDLQSEAVAALLAPELDEVPAELRQRTVAEQQALADLAASTPADVIEEAATAGFDLRSLTD